MKAIKNVIAIDPGGNGGVAVLSSEGTVKAWEMPSSESGIAFLFSRHLVHAGASFCFLEKVSAWSGKGAAGSFKFGRNVGVLVGLLHAHGIPFVEVEPKTWQKLAGISPRIRPPRTRKPVANYPTPETASDWKRRLLVEARRLYPGMIVTLGTADALLMAAVAMKYANLFVNDKLTKEQ